jgi:hypothetical protein
VKIRVLQHFPNPNAIAVQMREKCRSKAEIREQGGPEEGEVQEQIHRLT